MASHKTRAHSAHGEPRNIKCVVLPSIIQFYIISTWTVSRGKKKKKTFLKIDQASYNYTRPINPSALWYHLDIYQGQLGYETTTRSRYARLSLGLPARGAHYVDIQHNEAFFVFIMISIVHIFPGYSLHDWRLVAPHYCLRQMAKHRHPEAMNKRRWVISSWS